MKYFQLRSVLELMIFLHSSGIRCLVDGAALGTLLHTDGNPQRSVEVQYEGRQSIIRSNNRDNTRMIQDYDLLHDATFQVFKQTATSDGNGSRQHMQVASPRVRRDASVYRRSRGSVRPPSIRIPLSQYPGYTTKRRAHPSISWISSDFGRVVPLSDAYERPGERRRSSRRTSGLGSSRPTLRRVPLRRA